MPRIVWLLTSAGRLLQPAQQYQLLQLSRPGQRVDQLGLDIEIVLDDSLVAAGDEHNVLDTGFEGLVHGILDDGPVDHGQ